MDAFNPYGGRVLKEVSEERAHQDRKHGGMSNDDKNNGPAWLELIRSKVAKAESGDSRRALVQIAALAVAAVESLDRQGEKNKQDAEARGLL